MSRFLPIRLTKAGMFAAPPVGMMRERFQGRPPAVRERPTDDVQEDEVARALDKQIVVADEQVLSDVIAQRGLQREDTALPDLERLLRNGGAGLWSAVLDDPDAVDLVGLDKERAVGGVHNLSGGGETLIDEPEQFTLGPGMQGQAGLIEEDDDGLLARRSAMPFLSLPRLCWVGSPAWV